MELFNDDGTPLKRPVGRPRKPPADPADDRDETHNRIAEKEAKKQETRALNVKERNYIAAMYAIPVLYYAKTQRGLSAYKMQKLLYPKNNTQHFVAKLLQPELIRFDFIFKLSGVIGAPLDVCLALLFSIYRKEAPYYMKAMSAPNDIMSEKMRPKGRVATRDQQELTINVSVNSRYRFLRYLLVTKDIPLSVYLNYLGVNRSAFSDKCKSLSLMTLMDVIKICAITDEPISVILNKAVGNVGKGDDSWLYIHSQRVDGTIPVKYFSPSERPAGKVDKYNRIHLHKYIGQLSKNRVALADYMEKLLGNEGDDIWRKRKYVSRGVPGDEGASEVDIEIEEDDKGGEE
jgi:hypothetical protein